jgi:hypothetical protein
MLLRADYRVTDFARNKEESRGIIYVYHRVSMERYKPSLMQTSGRAVGSSQLLLMTRPHMECSDLTRRHPSLGLPWISYLDSNLPIAEEVALPPRSSDF